MNTLLLPLHHDKRGGGQRKKCIFHPRRKIEFLESTAYLEGITHHLGCNVQVIEVALALQAPKRDSAGHFQRRCPGQHAL